jgi:ribosomal protein L21E
MKNPSSRITKFIFKLLEFDIDIKHKPGSWNLAADCLSRYPVENINTLISELKNFENDESIPTDNINIENLKQNQLLDEFCNGIITTIKTNINSKYKKKSRQFCIKNDLLYFKNWSPYGTKNLLVIPKNLINTILKSYHDSVFSGHFGITKTLAKLKLKYYWPTMIQDTIKYIKSCHSCQMIKNPPGKGHGFLHPIPLISGKPMQRLTFDYLGPLPPSNGKKYIIVATCNATKMAFAKAVTNANGTATINFLMDIITSYGVPKYFCSDRGTHFKNKEMEFACKKLGITQIFSSAYHPQTNGMTELMNKIICNSLSHYVNENQKNWSMYYKMVVFAYNTTPSSRLKLSPFYLLHGIEANQPLDNKLISDDDSFNYTKTFEQLQKVRETIPKIIEKEQAIQKSQYDKKHKNIEFTTGQKVLIKFDLNVSSHSKKLANKYRGPFTIIEKLTDVSYKVELILNGKTTIDVIHVQRMKPFYDKAVLTL